MFTITVCTDAGHKNAFNYGYGVWAAYIRTPHKTIRVSGVMKESCKGSTQAELYAIANALHIVAKTYDLSKYRLILYSDNVQAINNHIQRKMKLNTKSWFRDVYDEYIRYHISTAAEFEARHVKAHVPHEKWGANFARHFMQDWCDREVHRLMRITINTATKNACVYNQKSA